MTHSPLRPLTGRSKILLPILLALGLMPDFLPSEAQDEPPPAPKPSENLPETQKEAIARARWLHEVIHGALQVMHRDFFGDGDDGALTLPSQSMEDVFKEMARSWSIDIRWLGGNATQDKDHDPVDEFEEAAVKALIDGKLEYSKVENKRFRYVGAITLHNQCLKCHVPLRSSLENRVAGLAITMPFSPASNAVTDPKAKRK